MFSFFTRSKVNIKGEKGASAVEFALVLPVLVLLVFGIVQFGILFYDYISITHAAREGVRWAALHELEINVKQKTIDAAPSLNPSIAASDITVSNPAPTNDDQGEPVTVTVLYTVPIDLPLMQTFLGSSVALTSAATQRIE